MVGCVHSGADVAADVRLRHWLPALERLGDSEAPPPLVRQFAARARLKCCRIRHFRSFAVTNESNRAGDTGFSEKYGYLTRGVKKEFWWFRSLDFAANFALACQIAFASNVALRIFLAGAHPTLVLRLRLCLTTRLTERVASVSLRSGAVCDQGGAGAAAAPVLQQRLQRHLSAHRPRRLLPSEYTVMLSFSLTWPTRCSLASMCAALHAPGDCVSGAVDPVGDVDADGAAVRSVRHRAVRGRPAAVHPLRTQGLPPRAPRPPLLLLQIASVGAARLSLLPTVQSCCFIVGWIPQDVPS